MTDEQFRALCNTYGFAPSRSLRELLDTATAQARIAEREACAAICDTTPPYPFRPSIEAAHAIRARGQA